MQISKNDASGAARAVGQSHLAMLAPVAMLLASVALLITGHGLQQTLLPIRAGLEGFSSVQVGLLGSCFFAGYVSGCLLGPRLVIRAGHVRAFAALVAFAASAALLHAMLVHPVVWMLCRAVTGACIAGLYLIIESWLNERADNKTRGTIMATYVTINFSVVAVGQMLVPLMDPLSFVQLSIAAILIALSTVPVALTTSPHPAPVTLVRLRPRELFALSPAGVVAVFFIGLANGSFWALGPSYGQQVGFSVAETASFMTLAVIGGALFQYPMGLLSDRIDRRYVFVGLTCIAAVLGSLLGGNGRLPQAALFPLAFAFGAAIFTAYTVVVAHVFDHARADGYVEVSAGVLLLFGIGSVIGPIAASTVMGIFGPQALFSYMAAVNGLMALYVTSRMLRREAAVPAEAKEEFVLANVAPVVVVGDTEAFDESPLVVDPSEQTVLPPPEPLAPLDEAPDVAEPAPERGV